MAKILVIEDNPANLKLIRFLLTNVGHTVLFSVDAETGIQQARIELPDLILMDIQLPGIDGLTATKKLKSDPLTQQIPVIALTALAMKSDQENTLAAGCSAYLTKPVHYQDLYTAINIQLKNETQKTL